MTDITRQLLGRGLLTTARGLLRGTRSWPEVAHLFRNRFDEDFMRQFLGPRDDHLALVQWICDNQHVTGLEADRRFGLTPDLWRAALSYVGVRHNLTGDEESTERFVKLYNHAVVEHQIYVEGMTLRDLSEHYGVPQRIILRQLTARGVIYRTLGRRLKTQYYDPNSPRRSIISDHRYHEAQDFRDLKHAAQTWGVTEQQAKTRLRYLGVKLPTRRKEWLADLNRAGSISAAAESWEVTYATAYQRARACGWIKNCKR